MLNLNVELFREILKRNNLSITRFSKEVGFSRDTVNNWIYKKNRINRWRAEVIGEYLKEVLKEDIKNLFYE